MDGARFYKIGSRAIKRMLELIFRHEHPFWNIWKHELLPVEANAVRKHTQKESQEWSLRTQENALTAKDD